MRFLGLTATTLLLLACGVLKDDITPPTPDPEEQAEIDRLRIIASAFRSVRVDIGKGQGIAGPDTPARAVNYSVTLRNPTSYSHVVSYSVYWDAGRFFPTYTGLCSDRTDKFPIRWPEEPLRFEIVKPFSSVVKPSEFSRLPDCFEILPNSGSADIYQIDGFGRSQIDYRIAEREGREYGY